MAENNLTKEQRRNATPSWNGYLHQGKVGILVALKNLQTEFSKNLPQMREDLKHLKIAYEYHEDFMILRDEEIVSTHQVKAKVSAGSNRKSTYGTALKEFDISTSPEDQRYLHVVTEIIDWNTSSTANQHNIQLFEYADSKLYSSIGDESVKDEAISYIQMIQPTRPLPECEIVYYQILDLLLNKVKSCHALNDHSHPTITFEEILESIEKPLVDDAKKAFEVSKLRSLMVKVLHETEEDFEINESEKGLQWEQVVDMVEHLCRLEGEDLIISLALLHPDDADFINSKNLKSDGFKNVFIEILRNIPSYDRVSNGYLKDSQNYFLSNISEVSRNARPTAIRILKNPNNTKLLFEGRNIVTKELEGAFVSLVGTKEQTERTNILKPEMLNFITVDNALAHLKDEDE